MTFEEWLEATRPQLPALSQQLEHVLELAYKVGYKTALENQLTAEPVAWEHVLLDGLSIYYNNREYLDPKVREIKPLYRFPPPRIPLTEKQIDMLTDRYWGRGTVKPAYYNYRQYVRAIEKLHGIT